MDIVGRKKEIEILKDCYESDKSEFVALYGRRRIGKTFLVKELFESDFTFYATGILNGTRAVQLKSFNRETARRFGRDSSEAKNWMEAFDNLNSLVEKSTAGRKVIFLDEIPWMATRNSDFLAGLDYFWNRWASSRKDVLLIICGSAASWIVDNIVNNTGGLHNRITRQISLEAFTLKECEEYFISRRIPMTRYQMAEAYMVFGGIPYYLSLFNAKLSLYQNIDKMYFSSGAELSNEFENLYRSLFKNADSYMKIIETIAKKGVGITRDEISAGSKIKNGGSLTRLLKSLSTSGFVREYKGYGRAKRDSLYQLVDPFSLFDIHFRSKREEYSRDFWLRFSSTPAHASWSGFAFEKLCLTHLQEIRKALGISGVMTSVFSWRGKDADTGVQIDLVIDRGDHVINLCEIKFSSDEYRIDKQYSAALRAKRSAFVVSTGTRKAVNTTMITTFGLKRNPYSEEITSQIVLDDFFE